MNYSVVILVNYIVLKLGIYVKRKISKWKGKRKKGKIPNMTAPETSRFEENVSFFAPKA